MIIDAGTLNRRIEIYHKVKTLNEINQTVFEYVLFKKVWANIAPQTGKASIAPAGTIASEITHKITIRYRKDITADMYIMYEGIRFDLKTKPLDPYMSHRFLELSVGEVVE